MFAGDVLTLLPDGATSRRHVGNVAAAIRPRARGGAVIAVERGFVLEHPDGSAPTVLDEIWSDPGVRMNEGGCDPDGRFYCGSMSYAQTTGSGTVYRLDPDGSVTVVLEHTTISNGLEWSPDGSEAYYVDTPLHRVDVFDYEHARGLHNRRLLVSIPADGAPDGLTVDAEGGIWVAMWGGGAVLRYLRDGSLERVIDVPASRVTACALGGPAGDELFITTASRDIPREREPLAGSLFSLHTGIQGQPVRTFAG